MALQLSRVAVGTTRLHFLRNKGVMVAVKNSYYGRQKIGDREVVGYGINGEYGYCDRMDFPCPAIRFKEIKGDLAKLRDKEKGDWKSLTKEEKKTCKCGRAMRRDQRTSWAPALASLICVFTA